MKSTYSGIMNMVVAMLFGVVATCLFVSCHDDDEPKPIEPPYKPDPTMADSRTVVAYLVAENSLSQFVNEDIEEMVKGMRAANLKRGDNLVVYVDDASLPRIYCINGTDTVSQMKYLTPKVQYDSDVNSASAEKLGEIIDYAKTNYPADSYGLVLWSHGSGWIPSTYAGDQEAHRRSFGIDNGKNSQLSNSGNQMNITDMASVLSKKCYFEFIFFDACFMQTIELDYELRRCTKSIVGSPAEIPGPGADYSTMIAAMFKEKDCAKQMVDTYYNTYEFDVTYGVIISAVDAAALDNFAAYMSDVCDENRKRMVEMNPDDEGLLNYFNYSKLYYRSSMPDFIDMQGIAKTVLSGESYDIWKSEYDKIIINHRFTPSWYSVYYGYRLDVRPEHCGGVSMFVPFTWRYAQYGNNYPSLLMDMEWGQRIWKTSVRSNE